MADSFFGGKTVTVEIDDENKVVVKQLTYGERQNAMSAAMKFSFDLEDRNERRATMDPFKIKREELYASIVSWDGPGFDNRPVTRENVDALPLHVTDAIEEAVADLNGELEEDEKKD